MIRKIMVVVMNIYAVPYILSNTYPDIISFGIKLI